MSYCTKKKKRYLRIATISEFLSFPSSNARKEEKDNPGKRIKKELYFGISLIRFFAFFHTIVHFRYSSIKISPAELDEAEWKTLQEKTKKLQQIRKSKCHKKKKKIF
jgi:hypothetical protein